MFCPGPTIISARVLTRSRRLAVPSSGIQIIAVFAVGCLALFSSLTHAAEYGVNLLANPGAENGSYSSTGDPVTPPTPGASPVPGWTTSGTLTVVNYGAPGGFPTGSPGPPALASGNQFFAGGKSASGAAKQDIDVTANKQEIDAGTVTADLSGWLGGYASDGDYATLSVAFINDDTALILDTKTIVGPTPAERTNTTGLFFRTRTVAVPAGTTRIQVTLAMLRDPNNGGGFNDGYADVLGLVLRAPQVVTTPADAGPGSLRSVLASGNFITFDADAFSPTTAPHVITLESALPDLNSNISIYAPAADIVTLRRNPAGGAFRLVTISNGTATGPKVTLSGLTISNGEAGPNDGGGILNDGGSLLVVGCVITGNKATQGGGIANPTGTLAIVGSTVHGNSTHANGSSAGGGLVCGKVSGPHPVVEVTIENSTFSENVDDNVGGAIFSTGHSIVAVMNSTFSGNVAPYGYSAGVYGAENNTLIFANCTISGNAKSTGASINFNRDTTLPGNLVLQMDNTIFNAGGSSDNFAVTAQIQSGGYNLSNRPDAILDQQTDRHNTDPMLGPLQDNGGPTFTHALLPGSLAIDKGNSLRDTDQRGAPRPVDDPDSANIANASDIGAFEFASIAPTPSPTGSPTPAVSPTPTSTATSTPTATVTPTPTATPGQALNISTRLRVLTGAKVLIGGFFITGTDAKTVIIRARGPSLATSEGPVPGRMNNPTLELHDGNPPQPIIASNDDWKVTPDGTSQQSEIEGSGFAPGDDSESAILVTLQPGPYTAILRGKDDEEGIGLVEVYDLASGSNSRLGNISTRGFVDAGDNVMIGGFFVGPENGTSAKLVIRAIGPSLATQGVEGAMDDPTITIYNIQGTVIGENDDCTGDAGAAEIEADHLQPGDERESATLQILPPGGYTAIVRGANGATGVALVEAYALQ